MLLPGKQAAKQCATSTVSVSHPWIGCCRSHVTYAQGVGYAIALAGVATYNYSRMHKPRQSAASGRVSASSGGGKAGARLSMASSGSHSTDWDAAVAVSETAMPLLAADGGGGDVQQGASHALRLSTRVAPSKCQ